jgi:hypothetical protein
MELLVVLGLVFGGGAVVVFGGLYGIQWFRFTRHLARPAEGIAPEVLNVWKSDRLHSFLNRNAETGAAGAISIGHAIFHLSRIDSSVMEAVDRIYEPERVNSFRDLVNHLEAKQSAGEAAWDGAINSYKGAFGETLLAEQLRMQGHYVELASDTSNPGFDAWVDGQPTQFKAGLGARDILEHRAQNPDIPVVTVTEHADRFADDPMVDCLDTVSGHTVEETTSDALESAIGIDDFVKGIPLVTAAISGFRNFRPVIAGHSDFATAARYTLADTAGVGIGGAVGAKMGACIGMSLGPIGAAIGAAIGGIGGAIGGRYAASAYKNRDLVAAKTALSEALARYPDAYVDALCKKTLALKCSAKRLHPKFRWASLVSLSIGDVVRSQGARALRKWAKHCSEIAECLRKRIAATRAPESSKETVEAVAVELVTAGLPEQVFSRRLLAVTSSIKAAGEVVTLELKKLGK